MKERIHWIDIAKGITIILVIIGHLNIKWFPALKILIDEIYTFHMPLFFILSGLTFSIDKYGSFQQFFKRKFNGLMKPYFIFSIIALVKPFYTFIGSRNIKTLIHSIFDVYVMGKGLWFLPCLLISECFLYFIIKYTKNDKKKYSFVLVALSVFGFMYLKYLNIDLPFKLNTAFVATIFVGIGYALKETRVIDKIKEFKFFIICLVLNIICNICTYLIYGNTSDIGIATNYFSYFFASITGSFFILGLSQRIVNSNRLEYLGRNSLIIYIFNDFILKLYKAVCFWIFKIETQNVSIFSQYSIACIMVLIVIMTMIPIIKITLKYFPFLIGKERKSNKVI